MRSRKLAIDDFNGPLMNVDEFVDNRKANPRALNVAARRTAGVESIKYLGTILFGYPDSSVGHLKD